MLSSNGYNFFDRCWGSFSFSLSNEVRRSLGAQARAVYSEGTSSDRFAGLEPQKFRRHFGQFKACSCVSNSTRFSLYKKWMKMQFVITKILMTVSSILEQPSTCQGNFKGKDTEHKIWSSYSVKPVLSGRHFKQTPSIIKAESSISSNFFPSNLLRSNLSTTASLGTEFTTHCGEMVVVRILKQELFSRLEGN